jgi:hypothetical protein
MNTKQLIIAAAMLVATGSTFAQATEYPVPSDGFVSSMTRAQVQADLNQSSAARRTEYPVPDANFASAKTRAQVQAELGRVAPHGLSAQSQEWNYPAIVPPAGSALQAGEQPVNDASNIGMMENCSKMMG